jgi:uncharacterized lipoprotein YmbA
MKKRTPGWIGFWTVCLTVVLILVGCAGRSAVERSTFVLDVARSGEASASGSDGVLRVRTLRVSPKYEGKGFVYRSGDLLFETDYYNQFFTPPDTMITEEVRDWLLSSGLFRQVVDYTGQAEHTHILEGEVLELYGDYSERGGSRPKAALGIEFFFMEDVSGESKVLLQKRYRRSVPAQGQAPSAMVQGWNDALEKILMDLEEDLGEIVR